MVTSINKLGKGCRKPEVFSVTAITNRLSIKSIFSGSEKGAGRGMPEAGSFFVYSHYQPAKYLEYFQLLRNRLEEGCRKPEVFSVKAITNRLSIKSIFPVLRKGLEEDAGCRKFSAHPSARLLAKNGINDFVIKNPARLFFLQDFFDLNLNLACHRASDDTVDPGASFDPRRRTAFF